MRFPKPLADDVLAQRLGGVGRVRQLQRHRPPEVVTNRGYRDPSKRQLAYIARLSDQLGVEPAKPKTRVGASRSIAALKRRLGL